MEVYVYLPSGKSCSFVLPPETRIREVKAEAQRQFKCRFLRLAFAGQQLDLSSTLRDLGVQNGDHIDAVVQPVKLASNDSAFAFFVGGCMAFAWGNPDYGGDSSPVQEQLVRAQQIQATGLAFAAILDDGSVVTWGASSHGGDSSQVREQLVGVQQINATSCAFAAVLDDGSVVTWGDPAVGGG
ncbi:unnamed protein product [Effrenium voratum]|nr:unnamed protein product [Effrenium voratum]